MKKPNKSKKDICLRCGVDKNEFRRCGFKCSAWGKNYKTHIWGVFKGKTIKIKIPLTPTK